MAHGTCGAATPQPRWQVPSGRKIPNAKVQTPKFSQRPARDIGEPCSKNTILSIRCVPRTKIGAVQSSTSAGAGSTIEGGDGGQPDRRRDPAVVLQRAAERSLARDVADRCDPLSALKPAGTVTVGTFGVREHRFEREVLIEDFATAGVNDRRRRRCPRRKTRRHPPAKVDQPGLPAGAERGRRGLRREFFPGAARPAFQRVLVLRAPTLSRRARRCREREKQDRDG